MVKLNRIYTKTGDDGTTGLVGGIRVCKDDLRVEVYGTVDEANAALGHTIILAAHAAATGGTHAEVLERVLRPLQHDLFDLGADLATPIKPGEAPGSALRIIPTQTERLERLIDEHNERLAPLNSFVLPGGTPLGAGLHTARTIVRRAERLAVSLLLERPAECNPEAVKYLNRLSDLLFVLARVANDNGARDVLWKPGANRV